ncbi:MAG: hypothetical protein HKP61_09425 [Dactylosporangium sp.]|nr:hypothetical protein [Dactylosporangium sp.]NNJ61152.1 hypothetical protein [Dactylosporangium sp.]
MTFPGYHGALPRRYVALLGATGIAALGAALVEYATTRQVAEAAEAVVAVLLGGGVAGLAVSLPGITLGGLALGGFFVTAGVLSWSYSERPVVVWSLLLVEGVVFAVWSRPWLRYLRPSVRLGTAWLGVSYWLLGIVGAVLVLHPGVAAQRLLYAGVFGLAVFAALAGTRAGRSGGAGPAPTDLSIGVVAAFLLAIAALLVSGSGNLFDTHHVAVDTAWGKNMDLRFWGGPWLLYHPNSLAGIAVAAAIRIGLGRGFAPWQRLAATVLAGAVIYVVDSRTGLVFLGVASVLHAGLLVWHRRRPVTDLPEYSGRRLLAAAVLPFLVVATVLVATGGQGFLTQQRYGGTGSSGLTSGRSDTWIQVGRDWVDDSLPEKIFGDAETARAVVYRESSGHEVKLTTDNAAVGALRRGGVLGAGAFLIGWGLLLRTALRRTSSAWLLVAAVAAVPTIATADWVLGGTGGTLWILLVTGETLSRSGTDRS